MAQKRSIAIIERHAYPINDPYKRAEPVTDNQGRRRLRFSDGYVGLGRRVITLSPRGKILFEERKDSTTDDNSPATIIKDRHHHLDLNAWMAERTEYYRRLATKPPEIAGDFESGARLTKYGIAFDDRGILFVESFFLTREIARSVNEICGTPDLIAVQVDTDYAPYRPDLVPTIIRGLDSKPNVTNTFNMAIDIANEFFTSYRDMAMDVSPSITQAAIAVQMSLGKMSLGAYP